MAESIVMRVKRVIQASIEDAVDAMERSGGTRVMRESIREVERVIDEVRDEHEVVTTRRFQAQRQQRLIAERLSSLEEKARFALGQGREDLAEAAISSQLDLEAQAERLEAVLSDTEVELARLEECLAELNGRKSQMEQELQALEAAQREASLVGAEGGTATPGRDTGRKVRDAESAFDRAMAGAGGVAMTRAGAEAAKVAEIDVMQKTARIAERMAALRAQPAG